MVGKAQALDMVEEEIAHPTRDPFGGEGCQSARQEGKSALEHGQDDEPGGDQDQGPVERTGERLSGAENGVGKIAKQ